MHKVHKMHILGKVLPDDTLLEMLYDPFQRTANLIVGKENVSISEVSQYPFQGETYIPNICEPVKRNQIVLPSKFVPDDDPVQLLSDIQKIVHWYVDLDPLFEHITSRYILMTWVYDLFQKVPYLRNMGPFNCGKSRFLSICKELCYHSSSLGTGVTPAIIFRWIEDYPGTIIFDEANYEYSSNSELITQILNGGYERDATVSRFNMRCYQLETFSSFGPKIIASHTPFQDIALESRFLTHISYPTQRSDIPLTLPPHEKWQEMTNLRNRLLGFRMNFYRKIDVTLSIEGLENFDHRLAEITLPLLLVTGEKRIPKHVMEYLEHERERRTAQLCMEDDGQVITALYNYWSNFDQPDPLISYIAKMVNDRRVNQSPLSDKRVGHIIEILGFNKKKINKGVIVQRNTIKLSEYAKRYGLA